MLRHRRHQPGIEHVDQGLDQLEPNPRVAHGQGLGPDHHHGPHYLRLDEGSGSRGVAAQEGMLKFPPLGH
jgi:hypothetical protein